MNIITKQKHGKIVWQYVMICFGIALYSFAWSVFLIPKHIIGGGVVGLSSVIYIISNETLPVGVMNFVFNTVLLLIGFRILGKKFALNTVVGMVISSLCFILFQQVIGIQDLIDTSKFDYFMSAILGAVLSGIGIGLCFANGGNSGGSDIVALIVTHYKNVSPGSVVMIVDAIVISTTFIIPDNGVEQIVYCLVVLGVYAYTLDLVISGRKQTYQITVFSLHDDEIAEAIANQVKRGVTLLHGHGWYSKQSQNVIIVMAQKHDRVAIMRIIKNIDPEAFISIAKTQGVYGKNFDQIKD
ncbi:MAG: YitT family protein [Bacteroidales bacterium]|jgi:uncharacterized membrane-anchored protein YitT (DUF2179 family)|nr:YitT family protein [Bacteroidales bacterium]